MAGRIWTLREVAIGSDFELLCDGQSSAFLSLQGVTERRSRLARRILAVIAADHGDAVDPTFALDPPPLNCCEMCDGEEAPDRPLRLVVAADDAVLLCDPCIAALRAAVDELCTCTPVAGTFGDAGPYVYRDPDCPVHLHVDEVAS